MNGLHDNAHSVNGSAMQRFFGSTNRDAMREVRLALGAEALIVSNRRVNGGVEILATREGQVPGSQASAQASHPFLPALLAVLTPGDGVLSPETVYAAMREMATQSSCTTASRLWQAWHRQTNGGLSGMTDMTVQHATPTSPLLVWHDQVAVATVTEGRGQLRFMQFATLTQGVQGSPWQGLQFAQGWMSSCGQSAMDAPRPAQACVQQVQWSRTQAPDVPMVHFFHGGATQLWQRLYALGASWVAQCAPGTVVEHEGGLTRVGSLARRAAYRVLPTSHWQQSLQSCAGLPLAQVNIWMANDVGKLRLRGQRALDVRVSHLRVQDKRNGRILRQCSALSQTVLDDAMLAHSLVMRQEQKWMLRALQSFWRLFIRPDTSLQAQATLAVHAAMAAWQIAQSSHTSATRQLLRAVCGAGASSPAAMASGLLRLFALQEALAH